MTGRPWAALLLLVGLVLELVVFVLVGQVITFTAATLLVVVASVVGVLLLRREGRQAWRGFQEALVAGTPPGRHVTDGVVGLGGALLLAVPGLVSGLAGVLLLTPPLRGLARGRMQSRAERQMSSAEAGVLFGPRRVRAWPAADAADADAVLEGEVLEGEVLDAGPEVRPGRDVPEPPPAAR